MKYLIMTSLLMGVLGCSTKLREDSAAKNYHLASLPSHWNEMKSEDKAKHFYQSSQNASLIGLSSICQRYQEASLETLSKSLTRPIEHESIVEQKRIPMDGREALETRAMGDVDGVPVEALFIIFRKNSCIFDFSLISRNKIPSSEESEFKNFVKAFRFEGSGE